MAYKKDKNFYYWLQRQLGMELKKTYEIHNIGVFGDRLVIWFLNNEDSISIPLDIMWDIYNSGKDIEELSTIIDAKYVARIQKIKRKDSRLWQHLK